MVSSDLIFEENKLILITTVFRWVTERLARSMLEKIVSDFIPGLKTC